VNKLYLGTGRQIITPEIGCNLYGYLPDVISTAVNDDLTATAFFFKQGEASALLVCVTVCTVSTEICDRIFEEVERLYGIPAASCMINASHTHSGPPLVTSCGWGDADTKYIDGIFIPGVLGAIDTAINSAIPVKMAVATGESYVGINRREITPENTVKLGQNPWGPFNPQMTVLAFKDYDGKAVANIIHYGAHGTAAGMNTEISRDWPGVMTDILETESGAVTAFMQGAEGDIGPRLTNGCTVGGGNILYAMRLGAVAGQDAVRIYKQLGGYYTPEFLSMKKCSVKIPFDKRVPLEFAKAEYEKFKNFDFNIRGLKAMHYKKVIESYSTDYKEPEYFEFNQSILTIGDVAIIGFPYEIFSEIALRIAKYSSIRYTLSLANTNGAYAYFATETELCRGGYEIDSFRIRHMQPFIPSADWCLIQETLKNIKSIENTEE
jgi:hypothetical protein